MAADPASSPRVLIEAPKDHGKSWALGFVFLLWRLMKDLNLWTTYVSNTAQQAEMHARPVIYQLETNKKLIEDFSYGGSFRPPSDQESIWRDREVIIQRPIMSEHPTLYSVGAGGAVLGRRNKLIVADDIVDRENSKSAEQREKLKYWYDNDLVGTLEPDGQVVVIGTPQDYKDLYSDLTQRAGIYRTRVDKAVIDWEKQIVLWQEKWSFEKLMKRRDELGSNFFNLNYQCVPISDDTSWFPYSWLADRCFDDEATLVDSDAGLDGWRIVIGCDLAISEAKGADYFVIFVLGVDPLGNHWLLHLYREKGLSFNAQISKVENICKTFKPLVIYVEDNAYQRALYQELRRKTDVPVKAWTTTGGKKSNEDIGIRSLSVLVENGKLKLPRGDEESKKLTDIFVGELTDYGKAAHDDCVMAWWFAENAARVYLKEVKVSKALV